MNPYHHSIFQNKRGGKVKLQSIVMPLSEFDHVEKGDALYGEFWFSLPVSIVWKNCSKLMGFWFIEALFSIEDEFCSQFFFNGLLLHWFMAHDMVEFETELTFEWSKILSSIMCRFDFTYKRRKILVGWMHVGIIYFFVDLKYLIKYHLKYTLYILNCIYKYIIYFFWDPLYISTQFHESRPYSWI